MFGQFGFKQTDITLLWSPLNSFNSRFTCKTNSLWFKNIFVFFVKFVLKIMNYKKSSLKKNQQSDC